LNAIRQGCTITPTAERIYNRGFEVGRVKAPGFDALLEHGEADEAIGTDADGATEFGGVVDGDGDEIVGTYGLGRQVGAGFGGLDRAVWLLGKSSGEGEK